MRSQGDAEERAHSETAALVKSLLDRPGVTLVMGGTDTGKTTLIRQLASSLWEHALTAVVDSDVGQSWVGPPACVGACLVRGPLSPLTRAEVLHFVGNFSPQGHFLPLLSGLVRLVEWAKAKGAVHILADTTGFVTGGAALELKYHKVELTRPDHAILLQRGKELRPLMNLFRQKKQMEIHVIGSPGVARSTGLEERRENRQKSLKLYFQGARSFSVPLNFAMMINPDTWQEALERHDLVDRLVGLLDGEGRTLAMGVIRQVQVGKETLVVETPLENVGELTHLRLCRMMNL